MAPVDPATSGVSGDDGSVTTSVPPSSTHSSSSERSRRRSSRPGAAGRPDPCPGGRRHVHVGTELLEQEHEPLGAELPRSSPGRAGCPRRLGPPARRATPSSTRPPGRPTPRSAAAADRRSVTRSPTRRSRPARARRRRQLAGTARFSSSPVSRSPYQASSNSSVASAKAPPRRRDPSDLTAVLRRGAARHVVDHAGPHEVGDQRPVPSSAAPPSIVRRPRDARPRLASRGLTRPGSTSTESAIPGSPWTVRPIRWRRTQRRRPPARGRPNR